MKRRIQRWLFPVLLTLFLSGCASVPLKYQQPPLKKSASTGLTIALTYPVDQRTDKSMDKTLKGNLMDDLSKITVEEVRSTGIFKEVIPLPKGTRSDKAAVACSKADLIMNTYLKKMSWKVPKYRQQETEGFVIGLAFGIVGGTIYGMTGTDVYGNADLKITIVKRSTGEKIIDKDYTGQVKERARKMSCDTPGTKSLMAGKALKAAMAKFKTDLAKTFGQTAPAPSVSNTSHAQ